MAATKQIKTAFERQTKAVTLRASVGRGTAVTTVRLRDGLKCDVEDGRWRLTVDANPKWGGTDEGPNPGILGRGALGSCLAQAYVYWAARLDVPLESLTVEIHADYDTRGIVGLDDVSPAYSHIRYVVSVESPAVEGEVIRMIETAEARCPYLQIFAQPVTLTREVRLNKGDG